MIRERRGSVTVFIMVFLTTILSLTMLFIGGTKAMAIDSGVQSLGHLWAKSILGEYTDKLYERYGIFAYDASSPRSVDNKLNHFCDFTFKNKKYIDCKGCSSSLYMYSLADLENFQKQINLAGITEKQGNFKNVVPDKAALSERIIENEALVANLPSKDRIEGFSLTNFINKLKQVNNIRDVVKAGGEEAILQKYIKNHFQSLTLQDEDDISFLKYELEYIIAGKESDKKNQKTVRNKIIAAREALNIAYINNNPTMKNIALIAAELISPPPTVIATQQALIASWAFFESVNDYKLLVHGKKVPLMKDDKSWAIDLKSIITNTNPDYIETENQNGNTYNEYLLAMIFLMNTNDKLLRVMDLIQMNMKYCYYGDFNIANHYTGLKYNMEVNGKVHNFEAKY